MTEVRFVHAADLHLDSPFRGLTEINCEVGDVLREATFQAYDRIIDLCIERNVDALLIAGDIYDGADRSLQAQFRFIEGLERLDRVGIRSFICHGNHDPLDGWSARLRLPAGCQQFGTAIEAVPLDAAGRVMISSMSYPSRAVTEDVTPGFQRPDCDIAIGMLHCNVGDRPEHGNYAPATLEGLERTGFDYWALGHVHTCQILRQAGPAISYPGNPQGLHSNETGPRGVHYCEIDQQGNVSIEFEPVCAVRWERIEIDASPYRTEQALIDNIEHSLEDVQAATDGCHVIVRIEIRGRSELHASLARTSFLKDVQQHINARFGNDPPILWCARIVDLSAPAIDRNERLSSGDFLASVLANIDKVHGSTTRLADLRDQLAPLLRHQQTSRYRDALYFSDEELCAMVDEAETQIIAAMLDN